MPFNLGDSEANNRVKLIDEMRGEDGSTTRHYRLGRLNITARSRPPSEEALTKTAAMLREIVCEAPARKESSNGAVA